MSDKIRLDVHELNRLITWLGSLSEDDKENLRICNVLIEIKSHQTGIGNALKAYLLEYQVGGYIETDKSIDITSYDTW